MTTTGPPVTLRQAAELLNLPLSTVRAHVHVGTLRVLDATPPRPGDRARSSNRGRRTYRVELDEIERFKDSIRTIGTAGREPIPAAVNPAPVRFVRRGRPPTGAVKSGRLLGEWE